jgi:membrane-bound serine protease (ClpP class)
MIPRLVRLIGLWVFLAFLVLPGQVAAAQAPGKGAMVLTLKGPLTPAMAEYLDRGLKTAQGNGDEVVILELNTPGGDINLMDRMTTSMRASPIPVVVYVYPSGSMAGSAGTVITLAAHVAAMAPQTTIGAASPVGSQGTDLPQTESQKIKEMMKATVRGFTSHRPPAAIALAQNTIENAQAVSAQEAAQIGLVDFIANDPSDLLNKLNGFKVNTISGDKVLNTAGLSLQPLEPTLIEQLFQLLTDPNIVFLLLTLGVQAILIELANPGGWVAGFIGAVALAMAVYGLGILPVNWVGIIFLILSFILFFLDIKAPTHGALTAAGLASFILGALVLFNSPNVPSFQRVSVPLVIGTGLVTAAIFFTIVSFGIRAMRVPVKTGDRVIIGKVGTVRTQLNPEGTVQVSGELWTACAEDVPSIPKGADVEVLGVEGLKLRVRPVSPTELSNN